ncbi:MAG: histidine phosphatase family protein [Acidobacteria bacterium]|nr:MAG: histidine phosphatase family protein [Acidobacteriota bacterium]
MSRYDLLHDSSHCSAGLRGGLAGVELKRTLILIRHGQVHERYRGVCYGTSDVELSERGKTQSQTVASELANQPLARIYHSDVIRTRFLAELLAEMTNRQLFPDKRLRERCFGTWELQTWDAIYSQTGNAMDGMIDDPESFAPEGGESTFAFRDRVFSWYNQLPDRGTFAVVAHGGTIAALLGTLKHLPVRQWPDFIPACGKYVIHTEEAHP